MNLKIVFNPLVGCFIAIANGSQKMPAPTNIETSALSLTLAACIDRPEAEDDLDGQSPVGIRRSPYGIYRMLAVAASRSPRLFARCAARIDACLRDARVVSKPPTMHAARNESSAARSCLIDESEPPCSGRYSGEATPSSRTLSVASSASPRRRKIIVMPDSGRSVI